jgi:tetratricopeptide (TPR) repeat protein
MRIAALASLFVALTSLTLGTQESTNSFERGQSALQQGRIQEAAYYFKQSLTTEPGNLATLKTLAGVLVDLGRPSDAEEAYRKVLELNPADSAAASYLGLLLFEMGKRPEGRSLLEETLEREPAFGLAHFHLGLILMRSAEPETALAHFVNAIEGGVEDPRSHFSLAVLYSLKDEQKDSIRHLRKTFEKNPEKYVPRVLNELKKVRCDFDRVRYSTEFNDLLSEYREFWPGSEAKGR